MMQLLRRAFLAAVLVMDLACEMNAKKDDAPVQTAKPPDSDNVWDKKIKDTGYTVTSDKINAGMLDSAALEGPSAAPKIAAYLEDPGEVVREKASQLLIKFGKGAESAIGRINQTLHSRDPKFRIVAAKTLSQLGSENAIDGLKYILKDSEVVVAAWAHAGLSNLGENCVDHLEELAAILKKAQSQSAMEVARAADIVPCQSASALLTFCENLKRGDNSVKAASCHAIGHFGSSPVPCVNDLVIELSNKDFQVRREAVLATAKLGEQALPAVDSLVRMLSDPSPRFRELAAAALGAIGPKASAAVGALNRATVDTEATVQAAAKRALVNIQQKESIPTPAP